MPLALGGGGIKMIGLMNLEKSKRDHEDCQSCR